MVCALAALGGQPALPWVQLLSDGGPSPSGGGEMLGYPAPLQKHIEKGSHPLGLVQDNPGWMPQRWRTWVGWARRRAWTQREVFGAGFGVMWGLRAPVSTFSFPSGFRVAAATLSSFVSCDITLFSMVLKPLRSVGQSHALDGSPCVSARLGSVCQ